MDAGDPYLQRSVNYEYYILPGLTCMVLLFSGMPSSLSMVYARAMGVMRLLLTAPLPRWYLLTAKLLSGTFLSVIQAYAFLIICLPFDWWTGLHVLTVVFKSGAGGWSFFLRGLGQFWTILQSVPIGSTGFQVSHMRGGETLKPIVTVLFAAGGGVPTGSFFPASCHPPGTKDGCATSRVVAAEVEKSGSGGGCGGG